MGIGPGDLVICIEDHPSHCGETPIAKNRILTIRNIFACPGCGSKGFFFEEVRNETLEFYCSTTLETFFEETPYDPDYFSPLDTGEEDIEVTEKTPELERA